MKIEDYGIVATCTKVLREATKEKIISSQKVLELTWNDVCDAKGWSILILVSREFVYEVIGSNRSLGILVHHCDDGVMKTQKWTLPGKDASILLETLQWLGTDYPESAGKVLDKLMIHCLPHDIN